MLRGLVLCGQAVAVGGVLFALLVVRPAVAARPALAPLLRQSLAISALGAAVVGGMQLLSLAVQGGSLAGSDGWPVRELLATTYVRVAATRVLACVGLVVGCLYVRRATGIGRGWLVLVGLVLSLVTSSAWTSHPAARLGPRGLLLTLDAWHQGARPAWIGGPGVPVVQPPRRGQPAWAAPPPQRLSP